MMESESYDESSDCLFNFESDHLALRGNREYSKILRTIALLSAQKIQIHNDIEKLVSDKNKYLNDPSCFVNDIFEERFVSPKYRCIPEIPETETIQSKSISESYMDFKLNADIKVRGRTFDQTKPETFNQLWTCEEQRRLEQLLIDYPVEPVEMRRFAKIAHALGNRTPQQVASRVQKFFKKLHSVGMPVPGRIPKNKKSVLPRSKNIYRNLYRRSTFFPAHDVPVNIPEDDGLSEELCGSSTWSNNKDFTASTTISENQSLLHILQEVRSSKASSSTEQSNNNTEKCENCLESTHFENRLVCNTCLCFISLCGDCIIYQLSNKTFLHINHEVIANKEI